jgi:hypothetical protein
MNDESIDRMVGLRMIATAMIGAMMAACGDTSNLWDDAPEMRLVALPAIDAGAMPDGGGFGAIADIEIGDDGTVFVLDRMNRVVHVFDDEGTPITTIGRRGEGPGQFEQPVALLWGPDDNLWVVDPGNGRYTVFDAAGSLVATYPHSGGPVFMLFTIGFSEEGLLYIVTTGPDLVMGGYQLVEAELVDGQVVERRRIELPFVEGPTLFVREGEGIDVVPVPFSPEPVLRIGPDGRLWYATTREPWVHRWSLSDGVEVTVGRELDAPAVSPAEREEELGREYVEQLRSVAPSEFDEFASLIPETKPPMRGFFLDDGGNVWIVRAGQSGAAGDALTMDVYDSEGIPVATGRAALTLDPTPRVRNDLLAGVVRDSLDVESIALYRIRR